MSNIAIPNTFVPNTLERSADVNANFAEIASKFNTFAVQTDVAKTITAGHTFSAAQTFSSTINGQTISSAANLTGSLAIAGDTHLNGLVSGAVQPIYLPATVTNATTVASAVGFALAVGATDKWRIEYDVAFSCDNTGGVNFSLVIPTAATIRTVWHAPVGSATAFASYSLATSSGPAAFSTYNSSAAPVYLRLVAYVAMAGNAGTITLQFASGVNTQTSTAYLGSTALAVRLA